MPAIEQSQAMVSLQDMCPGQIQYELAGSGCLGSPGQREAGNIPWCVFSPPSVLGLANPAKHAELKLSCLNSCQPVQGGISTACLFSLVR